MSGTDYTRTPNYNLYKPITGKDDDVWGDQMTANMDTIDSIMFANQGQGTAPTASPAYGRNGTTWLPVLPLVGGTLSGNLGLPSGGSATAPTLWFGATNNGIFSNAGTTLQFTANGAVKWTIGGTMLTATVPIRGAAGSAAAPTYSFSADSATGFYQPSANTIALSVGGNDVATATAGKAVSFMGAVTLAQDATLALQAVTLQQLNAKAGAYLPLVGGSITGSPGALALGLTLPANVYAGSIIASGAMTLASAVAWNQYVTASPVAWIQQATGFSGGIELNISTGVMAWMMSPNTTAGATPTRTMRMALRSEGALGVGITPLSDMLPIVSTNNGFMATADSVYAWNAYYSTASSGWKTQNAASSAVIQFVNSGATMNFMIAPSVAAGAAPALTTYMQLSAGGLSIYAPQTYSQGRVFANGGVSFGPDGNWEWVNFIDASGNHFIQHRSQWNDWWRSSDGLRVWTSTSGNAMTLDGSGNLYVMAALNGGFVNSSGNIMVQGGAIYVANNYNYYLARSSGDGNWRFVENGTTNFTVQTDGNCIARSRFTASYFNSTGDIHAAGAVYAESGFHVTGTYGEFALFDSGDGYRTLSFSNSGAWKWLWNKSNGEMFWQAGGVNLLDMRRSDNLIYNPTGTVGGNGAYYNISDARVKEDIEATDVGLPEILRLKPKRFRRVGYERIELGFVAQDILDVIAEAVYPIEEMEDGNPKLAVSHDMLLPALVNAVKTLNARLVALEAKA